VDSLNSYYSIRLKKKRLRILKRKKNFIFFKKNLSNLKFCKKFFTENNFDIIYHLAGQSYPVKSFGLKSETLSFNYLGCKNFIQSIKKTNLLTKFFYSSSSEIFGNLSEKVRINSKKTPVSPYGIAKLKAFNLVKYYRKKFHLPFYNGIIFNTESYLRPKDFIIPKICLSAIKAKNSKRKLLFRFGNINVKRDWGWCEEYVSIIWKILKREPKDFMLASGRTYSVKFLLNIAFSYFKLDWRDYIIEDKSFFRKKEINYVAANVSYLKKDIKFLPKYDGIDIVKKLISFYKK
jgi:GDPmannose 4,6-dehydratase